MQKNTEITRAFERIKRLEGIIPICMFCHKIRDDTQAWHRLEAYLTEHSDAAFSHSICPECMAKHYPGDSSIPPDPKR